MSYTTTGIKDAKQKGLMTYITNYIARQDADTTDPIDGPMIDNQDGSIEAIFAVSRILDKAGTSPTFNLILRGSVDGTTAAGFTLKDSGGSDIATGATSISGTDGTAANAVIVNIQTTQEGVNLFPPFVYLREDLGGTSPGAKGNTHVAIKRRKI